MISLFGRWTRVQIDALVRNGWLTNWAYMEITTHSDSCKWYLVLELSDTLREWNYQVPATRL